MRNITFNLDNLSQGSSLAPLFHRFQGEATPQPAYVTITDDGEVSADYDSGTDRGVPADVWNHKHLRWRVSNCVKGQSLTDFLRGDALPLLERIHAGHLIGLDGSNRIGTLDDDATDASDSMRSLLEAMDDDESATVRVVAADDWLFENSNLFDHWPDDELTMAVIDARFNADLENVWLDGDIQKCLLKNALSIFDDDDGRLRGVHLSALVEHGEITQEQANEYRSDHCVTFDGATA